MHPDTGKCLYETSELLKKAVAYVISYGFYSKSTSDNNKSAPLNLPSRLNQNGKLISLID